MAAALRRCPARSVTSRIRPWLFRVADNEAISLLRKRRASVPADAELVDRTAVSQEAELATRERLRSLVADLGELPERQRSAIVMRELTGLSYGEIGAALSCSEGGARQAVTRPGPRCATARRGAPWKCGARPQGDLRPRRPAPARAQAARRPERLRRLSRVRGVDLPAPARLRGPLPAVARGRGGGDVRRHDRRGRAPRPAGPR